MAVLFIFRTVLDRGLQTSLQTAPGLILAREFFQRSFQLTEVERRVRSLAVAALARLPGLAVLRLFLTGLPLLALSLLSLLTLSRLKLLGRLRQLLSRLPEALGG